jgi:hypothetical protein
MAKDIDQVEEKTNSEELLKDISSTTDTSSKKKKKKKKKATTAENGVNETVDAGIVSKDFLALIRAYPLSVGNNY